MVVNMLRKLIIGIFVIFTIFAIYGLNAFYAVSFNINTWTECQRGLCAFEMAVVFILLMSYIVFEYIENKFK